MFSFSLSPVGIVDVRVESVLATSRWDSLNGLSGFSPSNPQLKPQGTWPQRLFSPTCVLCPLVVMLSNCCLFLMSVGGARLESSPCLKMASGMSITGAGVLQLMDRPQGAALWIFGPDLPCWSGLLTEGTWPEQG